jgi:predicted MFS family arabinose efflux permease
LAQARAISFYTATFSLGTSLSFFATGELDNLLGWRWAFGFGAAGSLLALLIAAVALRPQPLLATNIPTARLLDFRPVLRNSRALAYILAYAAHTWELFALRSWLVAFLTFSLTLQPNNGGYMAPSSVAALVGLIAMWGSVGGAELAMRFGRRRVLTLIMGGSALIACGIGFTAPLPYSLIVILFLIYALFVQGDSAALHTGTVQMAEKDRRGATMAVQSLVGFSTAFAGPLVVGMVLDATGSGQTVGSWGTAFISMGVVVAMGPVFLALLARKDHRNRN